VTVHREAARVGVVVVHWRGMDATAACLASLARLEPPAARIVVAVNGPGDFDEAAARAACGAVEVVGSDRNRGYGGGCNLGARTLLDGDAPGVLWFLNNDTLIASNALAPLADAFAADDGVGIAGPVVVYAGDPGRVWFAGGRLNRTLGYTRHIGYRSRQMPAAGARVDFISGAAIAVRTPVWERLGGFDEAYFHYFEDTDLCERARRLGYASYVVPEPLVQHRVSAAIADAGADRLNGAQSYYFARNRWRFVRRNMRGIRRVTALAAQPLLCAYESAQAARARNWAEVRGRLAGLAAGMLGRTGPR
jgi:GT2 family glycosyltransferase